MRGNISSVIDRDYFDSDGCVVIDEVDCEGEGWASGVVAILRSDFPFFELVEEGTQAQITSLYTVGRVLKPCRDHLGYSIIVHMSDEHATLLSDFGNFVKVTINELHGFRVVGLYDGPAGTCALPPQNPLDRLKDQMDNLIINPTMFESNGYLYINHAGVSVDNDEHFFNNHRYTEIFFYDGAFHREDKQTKNNAFQQTQRVTKMIMPTKLSEYLHEMVSEGHNVLITSNHDGHVAIIPEVVTGEDWVVYIEWHDGSDAYSVSNINGAAFKLLQKILNNGGKI